MDKLQRREIKHDRFVEEVGHTLEYATEHKNQVVRYGSILLALVLVGAGLYFWRGAQHNKRQESLREALRIHNAQISPVKTDFVVTYPTQDEKDKALLKSWQDMSSRFSGSNEGAIADFYLGTYYADKGNTGEAEKYLKRAIDEADEVVASQARLTLSQLYSGTNRAADAERLLRELIAKPTALVSKEQATVALARLKSRDNPAEARKLLEPLSKEPGGVGAAAITALGQLSSR